MRDVPLRRRLFLLAAVAILPLAAMAGVGLFALMQQQRAQADRASLDLTRALAIAVDAELHRSMSVLEALATSPLLDGPDTQAFGGLARRVLETRAHWLAVDLADPAGVVVVDTGQTVGGAPPPIFERESFERAARAQQPVVGALSRGPGGEFAVRLRVPVKRHGKLRYVLTGVLEPEAISQVILRQRVPADWVVSVFDAKGLRLARSRGPNRFIGMPATPSLQQLMGSRANEGVGITLDMEGESLYTAYTRLKDTGWTVTIGVPTASVDAGALGSMVTFSAGVALSLVLGTLAALAVARSINRPMGELRRAAQSLGQRESPVLPASDIHEIQEVTDALAASARQRADSEAEREDLLAAERAARAAAEQARRGLELLATAGTVLSHSLEPNATLQAIASIVVPRIADWCRMDLVDADGVLQRAVTHHRDPDKARFGAELAQHLHAAAETPGSMAWVVATGRSHLAHFDPPTEFDEERDHDLLSFARAIGMRSYFIVPLIARGRTLGALAALQAESGRPFSEDDCALIRQLAQRAALALDNARLYAQAQAARQQAETANRVKDEFLAMLGHELRNPLAPIVTALHLMERRGDDGSAAERRIIERQVTHLRRLVDDLLDVSRITQGKIQLQRERVDMKAVVARALELTHPVLETRARPVDVDLPAESLFVWGDAVRLAQVLSNLLTNAAKFTPSEGRIALRLHASNGSVEVAVEDEGSGIEGELMPHVFDLFVQGEQPLDRHVGGLGLGLAIVKTLVRMHGGNVSAASGGAGRGSVFVVRLPLAEGAARADMEDTQSAPIALRSGRILVVDDNADAAETLSALLRLVGHEVRTAPDGPTAIALLDSFVPDLAMLDIGLPGMDGYELARRLHADARVPGLRLVALTGYGREPDRVRALAAKFDEHLVKPVAADQLLEVVERLLRERLAPSAAALGGGLL